MEPASLRQLIAAAAMAAALLLVREPLDGFFAGSARPSGCSASRRSVVAPAASSISRVAWVIGAIDRDDICSILLRRKAQ